MSSTIFHQFFKKSYFPLTKLTKCAHKWKNFFYLLSRWLIVYIWVLARKHSIVYCGVVTSSRKKKKFYFLTFSAHTHAMCTFENSSLFTQHSRLISLSLNSEHSIFGEKLLSRKHLAQKKWEDDNIFLEFNPDVNVEISR